MRTQPNYELEREQPLVACDRCGFGYYDGELVDQEGLQVCTRQTRGPNRMGVGCYDEPSLENYKAGEE